MIKDSLKYALRFIIRLIIFFTFIYLINFISGKDLFISNVSALEPYNDIPNTITYWSTSENGITASIKEFNKYNTQWFGYTFNSEQSMQGWSFNFDGESYLDDKTGSVNFAIYSNVKNEWRKPFQIYIKDYSNNISSCYVDGTSNSQNGSLVSSPVSSVICPNVQVRGNYSIFISNLTSNIANTIGITKVTYKFATDKDIKDSIDKGTKEQQKTNDTIKDDNVDGSTSHGSSFFEDFDSGSEGSLTDVVSLPLQYIQSLNDSCKPFTIPLGQMDGNITIPCLSSIWENTGFSSVINTAKLILNGFICYKLLISLFYFFKDLKDPDSDKVEVMNL